MCVQNGDTLVSLARDYRTDWLQLWGANTHIGNPNRLANPGVCTGFSVEGLGFVESGEGKSTERQRGCKCQAKSESERPREGDEDTCTRRHVSDAAHWIYAC